MRRPTTQEIQLQQDLLAEEDEISGLVHESVHAIKAIARHGYAALNNLPAQKNFPLDLPELGFSMHQDPRYFRARRIVRAVQMREQPVPVPNNDQFHIVSTSTETHKRTHYYPDYGFSVSLPGARKEVGIRVKAPGNENGLRERSGTFLIGTDGWASRDFRYDDTALHRTIANPRSRYYNPDSRYFYYEDVHQLRDEYSAVYSGVLAVASLVADGLEAAHGIETDTAHATSLIGSWQYTRATENGAISPYLAEFLPRNLAEHAGAKL